ncbi:MAG: hypothetical protein JNM41_07235 [Flavipsychrobacter sp.]|nr:hypothetical protein [Flavipsychrobacter sp.]
MEKPHYKQPITSDNIETALQFYLDKHPEVKYRKVAQNSSEAEKKEFELMMACINELIPNPSMYDIEALLEEYIPLFIPKITYTVNFNSPGARGNLLTRIEILNYILTAALPQYWKKYRPGVTLNGAKTNILETLSKRRKMRGETKESASNVQ